MNYMSSDAYKRKIKKVIEERLCLDRLRDDILEKFNEYDLQIDKFDDLGTYLDEVSNSFVENSAKIRKRIAAKKRKKRK
jgi:uncharacterized protein YoxC